VSNLLQRRGKVLGAIALTILWVCCFLFISSTVSLPFAGITLNLKFVIAILGILILLFYHFLYPSSVQVTKLSWTTVATSVWLAVTFFYPYLPQQGTDALYEQGALYGGAVGFFALVGGLAVCLLWVHFFSDEIEA